MSYKNWHSPLFWSLLLLPRRPGPNFRPRSRPKKQMRALLTYLNVPKAPQCHSAHGNTFYKAHAPPLCTCRILYRVVGKRCQIVRAHPCGHRLTSHGKPTFYTPRKPASSGRTLALYLSDGDNRQASLRARARVSNPALIINATCYDAERITSPITYATRLHFQNLILGD